MEKGIELMSNQHKGDLKFHVATIGKTVGIKGEMKFHIKSDFDEQFFNGSSFLTAKGTKITLEFVNEDASKIQISGVDSLESAKPYTNVKLFSTEEETRQNCELEEGQYFWFDLIGCAVYEDGLLLGEIKEIERFSIDDYFLIQTHSALVDKGESKSFLVPYVDRYLLSVDIEAKRIELKDALELLQSS